MICASKPMCDLAVPRSHFAQASTRKRNPWPSVRPFKVLSIDGGGALGLLPCLILKDMEERFLKHSKIVESFDMVVGTSAGGIIALGLGQNIPIAEIAEFYTQRGPKIFPSNICQKAMSWLLRFAYRPYQLEKLRTELLQVFGNGTLKDAILPTCIPSFDGTYGEPCVFKTPHHKDYFLDKDEQVVDIAVSTAAAPTYFAPSKLGGYVFIDGGVWANNPSLVGVIEALTCYDIHPAQIRLLSLGCGQEKYRMRFYHQVGGMVFWASHFVRTAMRAQSLSALNQARLLIGMQNCIRLEAPEVSSRIAIDDIVGAIGSMPTIAKELVDAQGGRIAEMFFD